MRSHNSINGSIPIEKFSNYIYIITKVSTINDSIGPANLFMVD